MREKKPTLHLRASLKAEPAVVRVTFHAPQIIAHNYQLPPDDHPIHSMIGRVTVAWGHYELQLDRIISTLAGTISPKVACITAQMMGAGPRLTSILALLHLRKGVEPQFEKYETKIKKLQNETFEPQESRNRIVHDAWYVDTRRDGPAQFRSFPRKKLEYGIKPVDRANIEKAIADIKKLMDRAKELFSAINADVAASCEKQRREEEQILRERLLENQKPKTR